MYWQEQFAESGVVSPNAECARQIQHPDVMEMLDLWVLKAMDDGINITGEVLRQKKRQVFRSGWDTRR